MARILELEVNAHKTIMTSPLPEPASGTPVKFLPLGAIIQEFWIGGRNIVLGFPKQEHYQTQEHPYFGETIGRYANRISNGRIVDLNGRDYDFVRHERGTTTLHGGVMGWGKKLWEGPQLVNRNGQESKLFTLSSPDGDEDFPGAVEARVWYTVQHKTSKNNSECQGTEEVVLDVEYEVEMVGDEQDIKETVCCLTNHGYWNIGDGATIAGTEVQFTTDLHLEVNSTYQIPTGKVSPFPSVAGKETVHFTETTPAVDDCFVLDRDPRKVPLDTRSRPMRRYISMSHSETGIHLEAETTEPSFQFYSGDGINVSRVDSTSPRGPRSGIALEPNRYVDAVNREEWRSLVLLKRGEFWGAKSRFVAWCTM